MTSVQYVGTGLNSIINYGYEVVATYGTAATSFPRTFGTGTKITVNRKNNFEKIYGMGSRNAQNAVVKKFDGSASVEFILSNGSFLRSVLGAVADGGSAPYTHTYTEANTIPSFSIYEASELGTNDQISTLLGCQVMSMTLTCAVDELVKVRLECPYQTETLATSTIGSQVAETETPFTFVQGSLTIGSAVGYVQSIELTVNNNLEGIFAIGSRFLSSQVPKNREYNLKMSVAFSDVTSFLTKFLGASAAPNPTVALQGSLVLTFTNGLTTTSQRSLVITLANIGFDEDTLPKEPNEIIKEDITGFALSCTSAVYSNNTQVDISIP